MCRICVGYVSNLEYESDICRLCVGLYVECVSNMCRICVEYVSNPGLCVCELTYVCRTFVNHMSNMCRICVEYVSNICRLCVGYVSNMCRICVVLLLHLLLLLLCSSTAPCLRLVGHPQRIVECWAAAAANLLAIAKRQRQTNGISRAYRHCEAMKKPLNARRINEISRAYRHGEARKNPLNAREATECQEIEKIVVTCTNARPPARCHCKYLRITSCLLSMVPSKYLLAFCSNFKNCRLLRG